MKKDLLVTLADRNYLDQAKQLFSSVYFNAGWKGDYMLLAHEVPEEELKWFRDKGILVKRCKPLVDKKVAYRFAKRRYPTSLMSKFYLFTPEFKKWDNVVFLEADIIVRASLEELTKIKGLGGVVISSSYTLIGRFKNPESAETKRIINKLKKENINLEKPLFNAGVMAFSADIIKKNTFSKLKELLTLYKRFIRIDEETILNLFFNKKWVKLGLVYNFGVNSAFSYYNIRMEKIKGIVLHFSSFETTHNKHNDKPWHKKNYFHKEWKYNLERAELINLNKVRSHNKKWTKLEIQRYSFHLKFRPVYLKGYLKQKYLKIKFKIKHMYLMGKEILYTPDRIIGLVGIFLKCHSPRLYFKLKGIKNKFGLK